MNGLSHEQQLRRGLKRANAGIGVHLIGVPVAGPAQIGNLAEERPAYLLNDCIRNSCPDAA
jgi:hypothetical protein